MTQARAIATSCIARRARQLARNVSRIYDDALREHGIKISQLNLLVAVATSQPVQPSALAMALDLEKSTLSRNLKRMADNQWIRIDSGHDERSRLVSATPEGLSLLTTIYPAWQKAQRSARQLISQDETLLDHWPTS